MDCRIVKVEQGTDEWLDLRRCRITASRLGDVMAKPTTKRYQDYQKQIVLELLGHKNVETEAPEWFRHGKENEPKALGAYEWQQQVDVEHNVFLIHKEYDWFGASPDFLQLPNYDEGGEIKCRALYNSYRQHVRAALAKAGTPQCCPAENRHQIQGNMWITGFEFWWMVDYYIGSDLAGGIAQKLHRIAVPRDQDLIDRMEERCLEFMKECYELAGVG